MNPFPSLSSLSSNPLFSSLVTFYTLILLYLPHSFLRIFLSPVLISTAVLLLSLLRLGANQKVQQAQESNTPPNRTQLENERQDQSQHRFQSQSQNPELGSWDAKVRSCCFQWDVSAPLEVIYEEACEGEEEEESVPATKMREKIQLKQSVERYPSLSKYYPETDSDSDDDEVEEEGEWEIPEREWFRWGDHEDERDDGLIEIALDGGLRRVENEEFIEIDFLRRGIPADLVFPVE